MPKEMMISKTTILLLVGIFAIFMLAPSPDGKGNLVTVVFPTAFGQIPVLNVTTSIDAPCVPEDRATDLNEDRRDDVTGKPLCKCFETGTCDVFASPLDAMLEPFFAAFSFGGDETGQFFLIVIWGLIIGVIWLRTSSTMMTGVIGIGIATLFTFSEKTLFVGITLLILAIGIVIYQLYKQRLDFPSN